MTRISADWLTRPSTTAVLDALSDHQAYFVGGCVRDALVGRAVSDFDISTDARPEQTLILAKKAGLKALPTGIDHGTVTIVSDGVPYEVTTFRRDIETDGRRAVVAFSDRIEDDAMRRDFTFNALYADRNGEVLDPLGQGVTDLDARRVRFIGDPEMRIREDYLRILRYFRFFARFSGPEVGFDAEDLAAIAGHLDGLDRLAAERIGHEMRKLLDAPDPAPALATMAVTGVLLRILPGAVPEALGPLVHLEAATGTAPDWLRRLVILGGEAPAERLRLSKVEATELSHRRSALEAGTQIHEISYRHGKAAAVDTALIRGAPMGEAENLADAEMGAAAKFPITAADLMPDLQGPDLGARLKELEARWIASRFQLSREALLQA